MVLLSTCIKDGLTGILPWLFGGLLGSEGGKEGRLMVKVLLEVFKQGKEEIKLAAVLFLRRVVEAGNSLSGGKGEGLKGKILSGLYTSIISSSRQISPITAGSLNLMTNSAEEVWSMPEVEVEAFKLGYGYIRGIGLLLIKGKTKKDFQAIYGWQVVRGLEFWCGVLGRGVERDGMSVMDGKKGKKAGRKEKGEEEGKLKMLIYPLVQITLGVMK
jgi:nucleolar complex protein 2